MPVLCEVREHSLAPWSVIRWSFISARRSCGQAVVQPPPVHTLCVLPSPLTAAVPAPRGLACSPAVASSPGCLSC